MRNGMAAAYIQSSVTKRWMCYHDSTSVVCRHLRPQILLRRVKSTRVQGKDQPSRCLQEPHQRPASLERCTLAGCRMRLGPVHAVTPRAPLPTTCLFVCLLLARPDQLRHASFRAGWLESTITCYSAPRSRRGSCPTASHAHLSLSCTSIRTDMASAATANAPPKRACDR